MDQTRKKVKVDEVEGRIIINLHNPQGELVAEQLDIAMNTSRDDLQSILNQLIREKKMDDGEEMLFSFFHGTTELTDTVTELAKQIPNFQSEKRLDITYHPQSLFRIKPITRQTAALEGHEQPILAAQFRNQGDVAITSSGDTTIRLWDIETETPLHTFEGGHSNWVLCIQWSPDGQYFASGGMEGHVSIWNYGELAMCGKPLRGHTKWITSLAWEPLHLNAECSLLASSSKDGSVRLWSRPNNCCLITITAHQKCITKMLFGGNGIIYTASEDTTVGTFGKNGHKISELKGHGHWVNSIASSVDFVLRTACFSEDAVRLGQTFEKREDMVKVAKERYEKALGGKGERLVSASDDCTLYLWEHPKVKPIVRMTGHQQPVNHVQFSPDGRFIVSASFDKSLRVWDGYNGSFIWVLRGHVGPVYQVSWSSDSRLLLSASKDSTLKLWSLRQKKLLFDLPGHADEVYAVDWAPIGGEKAISGGKDRRVKIWRH